MCKFLTEISNVYVNKTNVFRNMILNSLHVNGMFLYKWVIVQFSGDEKVQTLSYFYLKVYLYIVFTYYK